LPDHTTRDHQLNHRVAVRPERHRRVGDELPRRFCRRAALHPARGFFGSTTPRRWACCSTRPACRADRRGDTRQSAAPPTRCHSDNQRAVRATVSKSSAPCSCREGNPAGRWNDVARGPHCRMVMARSSAAQPSTDCGRVACRTSSPDSPGCSRCSRFWSSSASHGLLSSTRACSLRRRLRFGAIWLAGYLLVGLFEEYFFRGYLQFTLARGINGIYNWLRSFGSHATECSDQARARQSANGNSIRARFWAAPCCSPSDSASSTAQLRRVAIGLLAAVIAVVLLSLWRTGSLWWSIGFHAAGTGRSPLYGAATAALIKASLRDASRGPRLLSGGLTGPEEASSSCPSSR